MIEMLHSRNIINVEATPIEIRFHASIQVAQFVHLKWRTKEIN